MSAAHLRRGGAARSKPRKQAKVAVPKRIAKRLPVDQARANKVAGLVFGAFDMRERCRNTAFDCPIHCGQLLNGGLARFCAA